ADLKNPGHDTMRRLNRQEYNNTVRDLLSIDIKHADSFPEDDSRFGFDNNGDVLSLARVLMDKYFIAAESGVNRAILVKPAKPAPVQSGDAGPLEGTPPKVAAAPPAAAPGAAGAGAGAGQGRGRGNTPRGRQFAYTGEISVEQEFATTGHYILKLRGYVTAAA